MAPKANRFILSYHFMGEMLILFLILYPLFYYNLEAIPFYAYLGILLLALICFLFLTKLTDTMALFMLMAPVIFIINVWLKFGLFISMMIALVFVWRFIVLYREVYLEHEMNLFQITLVLALIEVILFKDNLFIIILLMQLFLLTFGFFSANYRQVEKQMHSNMKAFIVKVILVFSGLLLVFWSVGSIVLRFFWDSILMPLWQLATTIFISIFVGIMYLLEKIPLPEPQDQNMEADETFENGNMTNHNLEGTSTAEYNETYAYIIIASLALIALIWIFIKYRKSSFKKKEKETTSNLTTSIDTIDSVPKASLGTRLKARFFNQPKHPVRKLIYRFEHDTAKLKEERRSDETIQEWFTRIGAQIDYHVYEQVRYGEMDVTQADKKELEKALKGYIQKRKEDLNE